MQGMHDHMTVHAYSKLTHLQIFTLVTFDPGQPRQTMRITARALLLFGITVLVRIARNI